MSQAKQYARISEEEFDEFMGEFSTYRKHVPERAEEIAYDIRTPSEDLVIRVWSSIDARNGSGRNKGADAIRTVIVDEKTGKPVGGKKRTNRIQTWRKNLKGKVESLMAEWRDYDNECDSCGSRMVVRDGKYGEFWGCTDYPRCKNTENL